MGSTLQNFWWTTADRDIFRANVEKGARSKYIRDAVLARLEADAEDGLLERLIDAARNRLTQLQAVWTGRRERAAEEARRAIEEAQRAQDALEHDGEAFLRRLRHAHDHDHVYDQDRRSRRVLNVDKAHRLAGELARKYGIHELRPEELVALLDRVGAGRVRSDLLKELRAGKVIA